MVKASKTAKIEDLKAEDILLIPKGEPEKLFPKNKDGIAETFRKLAQKWHPDKNSDLKASAVFAHVSSLKKAAYEKLDKGIWSVPNLEEIRQKNGKLVNIKYIKKQKFELGEFYICESKVVYVLDKEYKDLFDNGITTIKNFNFPNEKFKEQFVPQLPNLHDSFEAADGRNVAVFELDKEMILLSDLHRHQGGKFEPVHVAWIMTRLHNMSCYLEFSGLVHGAISTENVFVIAKDGDFDRSSGQISKKDHCVSLIGGWWYAAKEERPLLALPPKTANFAPHNLLQKGLADKRLDNSMIRILGRELLGDITGVKLKGDKSIPKAMADWLTLPAGDSAVEDFKIWYDRIIQESFGGRRFAELDVKRKDIYKPSLKI